MVSFQGDPTSSPHPLMAEKDAEGDPAPSKKQRTHIPPSDLPSATRYEKSYMHRDVLTHLFVADRIVITASNDGVIKFWDRSLKTDTNELVLLKQYKAHQGNITASAVSYDGAWLATAGGDHTLKI